MIIDINKLREATNLKFKSDYKLARRSDVDISTISKIFSGQNKNPRLCTIAKIARALNIKIEDIMVPLPEPLPE